MVHVKWTRLESVATNGPAAVQDISVALSFSIPAKPLHRPFMSRCYAVKIKLWGVHRPARVSEGIRWLSELVLPSVAAAAAFHQEPSASHDAFVLLDGAYSSYRADMRLGAAALRWPSGGVHVFRSDVAAAAGMRQLLLERRRCEWITFVRLDADDMLTQAAFRLIERSAPTLPRGDVMLHGAHRVDRVTIYNESGRSADAGGGARGGLRCAWDDGGGSFQLSQGQSVSLQASLWRALGAPYEVHGHHVHLTEIWQQRLLPLNKQLRRETPPQLPHQVRTATFDGAALYLKTFLSGSFVNEKLARGKQPQGVLRRAAAGCDRAQVGARVGAANAALLWRVRPPALTEADARQVTVLMGR